MARKLARVTKRHIKRRQRRANGVAACERLEARSMLTVAFVPDFRDPWGFNAAGQRVIDPATVDKTSIDAIPRDVSLPANQLPRQSWALSDESFVVLFGADTGRGTFRRYASDGSEIGWPSSVGGRVKDVSPIYDQAGLVDGFFVWGTVSSAADASWVTGGFDTTFGGGFDGFVARIRADGSLAWATLVGAAGADTVESVAASPDGQTLFVVGNTSSSGGFVNGTADQVHDATSVTSVTVGIDTQGTPLVAQGAAAGIDNNALAGTAASLNGYVLVMSSNGQSHIWSSYLSPNDPRNPQPAGSFTAAQASFVTDVNADSTPDKRQRVGIVVTQESSSSAGGTPASTTALVTLVEKPVSDPGRTGPRSRDYEFKAISPANIDDQFLASVRSRPASGSDKSSFFYYMTAPDPVEVDTVAFNPVLEVPGVPGSPSTRTFGLNEFRLDAAGNVFALQRFVIEVSSFSLTGFSATPDRVYLTGTTLSERPLQFGQQFSRYHTVPLPQGGVDANNYGDAVIVELTTTGEAVRSQLVGNTDSTTSAIVPNYGLKEKGGAIVTFPDGRIKLLGSVHARPGAGQARTPAIGGKLWTYQTDNAYAQPATAPTVAGGPAPTAALVTAAASSVGPAVQWTGYVAGSIGNDVIGDVWTIPRTTVNSLPDDKVIVQANGVRDGYAANTLTRGGWTNSSIQGTVSQVQLSADATKLYVAGSTVTPGWTSGGFDTTLGTYTEVYSSSSRTLPSNDGFFARINTSSGAQEYSTYLGGQGESFSGFANPPGQYQGNDFSSAFYVDPTKPGSDKIYVVGRSQARSGLGTRAGVTDQIQQEQFFARQWPNAAFDDVKSRATDATKYDGVLYSLADTRNGVNGKNQLNWASYLTPRLPGGSTDDNEPLTSAYLTMNRADFVWVAKNSQGAGNIVYVFGEDEAIVGGATVIAKAVYVFNDTTVNDRSLPITSRIKKYAWFYETPDQIIVDPQASRLNGPDGPAVYFRTNRPASGTTPEVALIRRIDLPAEATIGAPLAGLSSPWTYQFRDNETRPVHMAVSGDKLYVATTVRQYEWANIPQPLSTGKLRNGPSDAALMQFDARRGSLDWWMIQGGDGAEVGQAVAALPGDRVWLLGETASQPTERNAYGWVPRTNTGGRLLPAELLGNTRTSPQASNSQVFAGGQTDGFIVEVRTNVTPSKANVGVGGVVNGQYVAIVNNADTASTVTGTDFGSTIRGEAGAQRTFRIRNTGSEPLSLYGVDVPAGFNLLSAIPSSLAVGGVLDITIQVDSSLPVGTLASGDVVVNSNDADEGSFRFRVAASVIAKPRVTFSVAAAPASVAEGDSGTKTVRFTVTATPGDELPTYPVTVRYQTVGGTATAGSDFVAASGTLTFNAGGSQTVDVTVNGDTLYESDETFLLQLLEPSDGMVSATTGAATVTILNDDPQRTEFSVAAATASTVEGNSGTKTVRFTVTMTPGVPAPTYPVTVQYQTVNGTATAGSDYVAASGTLSFTGPGTKTVDVTIKGDTLVEVDENFRLVLSNPSTGIVSADAGSATVTLVNDDRVSVGFASRAVLVDEGNTGSKQVPLTVTLSQASPTAVTVNYATTQGVQIGLNGFATAGSDYLVGSGTVTFAPGETSKEVFVTVLGDQTPERDETLAVQLANASADAVIGAGTASLTIRNDDGTAALPAVRVSSPTAIEGGNLAFSITLARAVSTAVTLNLAYVPLTAKPGDFVAGPATVTIPAGRTTASVTVRTVNNTLVDGDRRLRLEVRNGATLVASGTGTIRDNDRAAASPRSRTVTAMAFAALATQRTTTSTTKKK